MGVRPDRLPGGARRRPGALAKLEAAWGAQPGGSAARCGACRPGAGHRSGHHQGSVRDRRRPGAGSCRTTSGPEGALAQARRARGPGLLPHRHGGRGRRGAGLGGGVRGRGHLHQRRAVRPAGAAGRGSRARRQPAGLGHRPEACERSRRRLGLRRARPTSCGRYPNSIRDYRGISYAEARRSAGCRCRASSDDSDGTPILLADGFASRKARFARGAGGGCRSRPATVSRSSC